MNVSLLQYSHILIFNVVDEPDINCNHDYDFAPEYHGNCPQPRRCAKCGALDLNGYRGMIK